MSKISLKLILAFIVIITFLTCIDPYSPELGGYENILVIEGMITDENCSYQVRLSRTFQDQNSEPSAIQDASIYISDNTGKVSYLNHIKNGIYKTDRMV